MPTAAWERYQRAQFEQALQALGSHKELWDAASWALAGRCWYGLGDFVKATEALEKAVQLAPNEAEYWHWLGRAWGRRAERSSFATAPLYAGRCRRAFERARELDPRNLEILSDLFSYYLEAPSFLGGGLMRARRIAEEIRQINEAEFWWAQAKLAEKQRDWKAAEQAYRRAIELSPEQVGRLLDLAAFLARVGRWDESEVWFERAEKLAPGEPKVWFRKAECWVLAGRKLAEARQLLKRYLVAELTPADPPRWEAERLLRRLDR